MMAKTVDFRLAQKHTYTQENANPTQQTRAAAAGVQTLLELETPSQIAYCT